LGGRGRDRPSSGRESETGTCAPSGYSSGGGAQNIGLQTYVFTDYVEDVAKTFRILDRLITLFNFNL
jgi:hypothetical protein